MFKVIKDQAKEKDIQIQVVIYKFTCDFEMTVINLAQQN